MKDERKSVTVKSRIGLELAKRVKEHGLLHDMTASEIIRLGLELVVVHNIRPLKERMKEEARHDGF